MQLIKNKRKTYLILFLALIILSNINPLHGLLNLLTSSNRYSTSTGAFTFQEEWQGRDTAMLYRKFKAYKTETNDTVLYRLFSKNPLAFWRYIDYINDPKYQLPYKNWNEIKKTRGQLFGLQHWQDF